MDIVRTAFSHVMPARTGCKAFQKSLIRFQDASDMMIMHTAASSQAGRAGESTARSEDGRRCDEWAQV